MLRSFVMVVFLISMASATAETIYLKDGTTLKGIVSGGNETSLFIDTDIGKLIIPREKISRVEYLSKEDKLPQTENVNSFKLITLENKKSNAMLGLLMAYGLTIVGDLAVDGRLMAGSAIPVIGPFINAVTIDPKDYKNPDNANRDKLLFLLSGTIQTILFTNYLSASNEIDQLHSGLKISPMSKGVGVELVYKY